MAIREDMERMEAHRLQPHFIESFFLEAFQRPIHHALAGFFGYQIPQMADFCLADTMNPPKPLLQPIGIPRQIVVES